MKRGINVLQICFLILLALSSVFYIITGYWKDTSPPAFFGIVQLCISVIAWFFLIGSRKSGSFKILRLLYAIFAVMQIVPAGCWIYYYGMSIYFIFLNDIYFSLYWYAHVFHIMMILLGMFLVMFVGRKPIKEKGSN